MGIVIILYDYTIEIIKMLGVQFQDFKKHCPNKVQEEGREQQKEERKAKEKH